MKQHNILIALLVTVIMLGTCECSYAGSTTYSKEQLTELYLLGKFGDVVALVDDHFPLRVGGETDRQFFDLKILRIRALIGLGKNLKALAELNRLRSSIQNNSSQLQLTILDILTGTVLAEMGKNSEAEEILKTALASAKALDHPELAASALNNLSIIYAFQGKTDDSVRAMQEALSLSERMGDKLLCAKLNTNLAAAELNAGRFGAAENRLSVAISYLTSLEDSYEQSRGLISIADLYVQMPEYVPIESNSLRTEACKAFEKALMVAQNIGAHALASLAAGKIGQEYFQQKMYSDALNMTREALFEAQLENRPDILYQWQWQAASILKAQRKTDEAIDMNRLAVRTLQSVRQNFAANDLNFFRNYVKPVYMDLADMLLKRADDARHDMELQSLLKETLETIELLRAEELHDYLQDPCVGVAKEKSIGINSIAGKTAVIYYIVFDDRIEAIVKSRSGIRSFQVPAPVTTVVAEARALHSRLADRLPNYNEPSKNLYDWLIRPLEKYLVGSETIIFVTDGVLRTIPMAVLNDGSSYLIEKYSIAVTQALTMTELTQRPPLNKANVFMGGISESILSYPALPYVKEELKGIQQYVRGEVLMNETFVLPKIKEELSETPHDVVHIASHGLFSGNVKDTYILTWDGKMTADLLERFVKINQFSKTPLDLLTLSACSTAAGDDRASLGLAGFALKAGARSAIASLWDIDDQATSEFFVHFYSVLKNNPGISKAKALQMTQLSMIRGELKPGGSTSDSRGLVIRLDKPVASARPKDAASTYKHPYYWAPFLISGNWQ